MMIANKVVKKIRLLICHIKNKIMNLSRLLCFIIKKNIFNKKICIAQKPTRNGVILVHTGDSSIPNHVQYCVEQIRLMDLKIPIYFVCSKKKDISNIPKYCHILFEEDIAHSKEHILFLKKVIFKNISHFFQVTIERFFILYDAMITIGIENVLHLENDNLLYCSATELLLKLEKKYFDIATPRANKKMSAASIMYIPTQNSLKVFLNFIINSSNEIYFNDMALLAAYSNIKSGTTLPTITKMNINQNGLFTPISKYRYDNENQEDYFRYSDELNGIFDFASLGQYLDGCDAKYHPEKISSFINDDSYLDPRKIKIIWIKNKNNLIQPFFEESGRKYLIYNLHIHSKRLHLYMSNIERTD